METSCIFWDPLVRGLRLKSSKWPPFVQSWDVPALIRHQSPVSLRQVTPWAANGSETTGQLEETRKRWKYHYHAIFNSTWNQLMAASMVRKKVTHSLSYPQGKARTREQSLWCVGSHKKETRTVNWSSFKLITAVMWSRELKNGSHWWVILSEWTSLKFLLT